MDIGELDHSPFLGAERARFLYRHAVEAMHAEGDIAECGVCAGDTSRELTRYVEAEYPTKLVHLFDSFEGLPSVQTEHELRHADATLLFSGNFARSRLHVEETMTGLRRYLIHSGLFAETLPAFFGRLCFIHADADLYVSTVQVIDLADRCLVPGGRIVFDDYGDPAFPGVSLAVRRHLDPGRYRITPSTSTTQCVAVRCR